MRVRLIWELFNLVNVREIKRELPNGLGDIAHKIPSMKIQET